MVRRPGEPEHLRILLHNSLFLTYTLMVRHGRAAAGFGSHLDPGLDNVGRAQAEATAKELAVRFEDPVPIYSSPLKRAQDTAALREEIG